jgi:hypothetical protein
VLHQTKNLLYSKGNSHETEEADTEWGKNFASYIADKGLRTKIYRELTKLNPQRINDPMKEWANELNRVFSKEEIGMAKST